MRKRTQLIGLGLLLFQVSVVRAQNPEYGVVLRAAGTFLRDSLPKQAIVVDNEMFRSRPAISAFEADDVARHIGAGRGRFSDVFQCVPGTRTRQKACTAREKKTVLAFARPVMRADSAEVEVYWVYTANDQLAGVTAKLTLIRDASGKWQVQSMRVTGVS